MKDENERKGESAFDMQKGNLDTVKGEKIR